MGLIPEPRSLIASGTTRMFTGLRTGDQRALLIGAAFAVVGWWRKKSGPEKTLIHRAVVPEGSSLVIRNGDGGARVDVRRVAE